jgi:signal peptidase I
LECEGKAEQFREHQEVLKAEVSHRYYKALKLAGAYAFVDKSPVITDVTKRLEREDMGESKIFPDGAYFGWNRDYWGPLEIPGEGTTIQINDETMAKYAFTIEKYEGQKNLEIRDNRLFINGQQVDSYTFKQNYYFMMGDNRHDSLDSRYWGFVPEDHVVGKAWFLWLSLDKHKSMFSKIRWNRFFNGID